MDPHSPLIYDDLRQVARCQQARMGASPTLQTTERSTKPSSAAARPATSRFITGLHLKKRLSYLAHPSAIVPIMARGKAGGQAWLPARLPKRL